MGLLAVVSPAETLAEKTLVEIVERQHNIFERAAKESDHLDEAWLRGELEGVIKSYDVLIQKNPDYALGYGGYGMLLGKVGMKKEAVIMLLKANKLDPTLSEVKNQIGVYLAEDGKPVDALPWVSAAIDLEPKKRSITFIWANCWRRDARILCARVNLIDAKIDQNHVERLFNMLRSFHPVISPSPTATRRPTMNWLHHAGQRRWPFGKNSNKPLPTILSGNWSGCSGQIF